MISAMHTSSDRENTFPRNAEMPAEAKRYAHHHLTMSSKYALENAPGGNLTGKFYRYRRDSAIGESVHFMPESPKEAHSA